MNLILNHSALIVSSAFSLIAVILILMNYSYKKARVTSFILGGSILLISFIFFINPPLIPLNLNFLVALTVLFLLFTIIQKIKSAGIFSIVLTTIPFILLEIVLLFNYNQEWIFSLLFYSLTLASIISIIAVFRKV